MEFKVLSIWHSLPEQIEETLTYYSDLGWQLVGTADHKLILQRKKAETGKKQLNG